MPEFNVNIPCASFQPGNKVPARRKTVALLFVQQQGRRFVVKSFFEEHDTDEQSEQRLQRELEAMEAFAALDVKVLRPVFGPATEFTLSVDGREIRLVHVLVFPFRECRTLQKAIADNPDPLPLIREAGTRIGERHGKANSMLQVHSDGAPHNILEDWTWFDFSAEHKTSDLSVAKSNEVWRFITGLAGVTPAGQTQARVTAFCETYADLPVMKLARDRKRRPWALLRMLARPHYLCALLAGDTQRLRRVRAWRALDNYLKAVSLAR